MKPSVKPIGKSFPNAITRIASYDPATQITIFEEMDLIRFKEVVNDINTINNIKDV